ncbi:glycine--tRNA ligase [Parcubacteria bacterium DG_72]|nr:MAG: glycine--tRNA ligase [Parcubacteria bacterium DG_72]
MQDPIQKIVSFAKRRGFIFQSSEIYGGFGSCYDFGPLGTELKNNIKKSWWKEMVEKREDIVGLDSSILMSPKVWSSSGHLTAGFADELVECKECHKRFRQEEIVNSKCPDCKGGLTKPKKFNLMMKTFVGPVEDEASITYLRAETCQGIYVNFKNLLQTMRLKIPFGIAQIGKAFRNEITPGNFIYRTREFEQMEMQWFCSPKKTDQFFDYWLKQRLDWYYNLGISRKNLRIYNVPKKELAHYAKKAVDIEYKFPFGGPQGKPGWKEIEGVHNRGDWDLSNHAKHSGADLKYQGYYPHIIETSAGADRSLFAFLCDAFTEVKGGRTKTTESAKEVEVLLKLSTSLAPVKVAVLPLVRNKPAVVKKAKQVFDMLKEHFMTQYDEAGSIGRRYRRQDEIGTPFSVTVDFDTLKDNTVTLRNRDTMKQERLKVEELTSCLRKQL